MQNYCTLFDSNYMARGVAMYESLASVAKDFHLYIFAFDDISLEALRKMNLEKVTVVSLTELENERLLEAKKNRGRGEYCWTCSSSTIKYVIEKYSVDNCTYIDADMIFYSDPKVLIDEMGDASVLIPPHRYSKRYLKSIVSGKYCVEFVTFKNTPAGMKVLNWWVDKCIEWCYNRLEEGKFGDQKYLDEFEKFEGVHVLEHLGGGVAPWNVQQYIPSIKDGKIFGKEIVSGNEFPFVFYHFHGLKFMENNKVDLSYYHLTKKVVDFIYKPYVKALVEMEQKLVQNGLVKTPNGVPKSLNKREKIVMYATRVLNGNMNVHSVKKMVGDEIGRNDTTKDVR
jgi:hypothetical protein